MQIAPVHGAADATRAYVGGAQPRPVEAEDPQEAQNTENGEPATAQNSKSQTARGDTVSLQKDSRAGAPDGFRGSAAGPQDNAPALTRRLVAARGQFEVRQVVSDANKALISLRIAAALDSENSALARAYIKKLEKLLGRANRKIRDLDKEDMIKIQKARAERQKQERRVEEIKTELRKRMQARRAKERSYLLGGARGDATGGPAAPAQDIIGEAAIAAKAEAIAAAQMALGGLGPAGGDSSDLSAGMAGTQPASAGPSPEGGGEIAV